MKSRFVGHRFLKQAKNHVSKWLIFSKQRHRVLISLLLLLSQKECETNHSREQNAAVFASRTRWRKTAITSLTEVTTVSLTNVPHEGKQSLHWMVYKKVLYAGPESARNILANLSQNPARRTTLIATARTKLAVCESGRELPQILLLI